MVFWSEVTALLFLFSRRLINTFDFEGAYKNMAPTKQGGHQAAGLCVAICFGIGGGIIVGKGAHQTRSIKTSQACWDTEFTCVLFRLYPEITYLGRCCRWQLFWWWALLGGETWGQKRLPPSDTKKPNWLPTSLKSVENRFDPKSDHSLNDFSPLDTCRCVKLLIF